MQRIRLAALGAALMFGIAASDAVAQQSQAAGDSGLRDRSSLDRPGRRGARADRMAANVGRAVFKGITLTDTQKEQIRAINARYKVQRDSLRKDIRTDGAARPDSTEVARARELNQRHQAELRTILTPDQQTVFDKNVTDLRARAQEGRKGTGKRRGR